MYATSSSIDMAASAGEASALLRTLSNEHRLLILCHLTEQGEMSVGELVSQVGLSQSALSQHLGKLRAQGLVSFRREAQSLIYRVCDERAQSILSLLHDMFCASSETDEVRKSPIASPRAGTEKGTDAV
jgi:DNA-binding transcriptional ArsR family regulator